MKKKPHKHKFKPNNFFGIYIFSQCGCGLYKLTKDVKDNEKTDYEWVDFHQERV